MEGAHGGRGRAGRGRRYQAGVPYARTPSVGRRRRGRGGRQRELQRQADRVVERVRVQHAGLLAVRHAGGYGRWPLWPTVAAVETDAVVADNGAWPPLVPLT